MVCPTKMPNATYCFPSTVSIGQIALSSPSTGLKQENVSSCSLITDVETLELYIKRLEQKDAKIQSNKI